MPVITRSPEASPDTSQAFTAPSIVGLVAGEDIPCAAPCDINEDGLIVLATASVAGFSARNARAGQPLTIYVNGARYHYSDGALVPGTRLYLEPGGELTDTASGPAIALAISPTDIVVGRF